MVKLKDEDRGAIRSAMEATGYTDILVRLNEADSENVLLEVFGRFEGQEYETSILVASDMDQAIFDRMVELAKDAASRRPNP